MKILVVGNHTCGNRGDGAIIRGLVQELESKVLNLELTLMSRFPNSSEAVLDYTIERTMQNLSKMC